MDFMKKFRVMFFIARMLKRAKRTGGKFVGRVLTYSYNKEEKMYRVTNRCWGEIRESKRLLDAVRNAYDFLEQLDESRQRAVREREQQEQYEI